jgi:uncharacterized damage-inducible protein DinB
MIKIELDMVPSFYQGYVKKVQRLELFEALEKTASRMQEMLSQIPESKGEYAYAPGKWTVKELLCHMQDAERIFAYRALTFSRNDKTELPGFDENAYTPEANAHARTIEQIRGEMARLRATSIDLFKSFSPEMLRRSGRANKNEMNVLVLGYVIAGHEAHHQDILNERYLK